MGILVLAFMCALLQILALGPPLSDAAANYMFIIGVLLAAHFCFWLIEKCERYTMRE